MRIYSGETIKKKLARRKKIGKAVYICLLVLLAFAVICLGTAVCQKYILKRKSVNLFGYSSFIVTSGSMRPSLQVNDIIVVKKADEDSIRVGDIISFFDKDGYIVTHRVSEIASDGGKNYYVTKGDANNADDGEVIAYDNIIGRLSFTIPGGGNLVAAVTAPSGIIFFILLFIFICIVIIGRSKRKAARHSLREEYKKQSVIQEEITTE